MKCNYYAELEIQLVSRECLKRACSVILQPILHRKLVKTDLLLCDRWQTSAESTKVSFAPWNLFVGMGTSENQHTCNVVDRYVESDQHQWSRDQCRTHLCTVQMRAGKELVMSYAITARSLAWVWAACTRSHIQLQVYLVTEFTSPQVSGGL